MFIVSLTYLVPLADIEAHLADHVAFLQRHFETGAFLLSGPKEPRRGGVILALVEDRARLDAILAEDPFMQKGLASYAIEYFRPTRFQPGLDEGLVAKLAKER